MHRGQALAAWGFALQCVGASGCAPSDAGTRTAAPVGAQTPLPTPPTVEAGLESGTDAASQLAVPRLDDVVDAGWPAFLLAPPIVTPPLPKKPIPLTIDEAVLRVGEFLEDPLRPGLAKKLRGLSIDSAAWIAEYGDVAYLVKLFWDFEPKSSAWWSLLPANPLRQQIIDLGLWHPDWMAELLIRMYVKRSAGLTTSAEREALIVKKNHRNYKPPAGWILPPGAKVPP